VLRWNLQFQSGSKRDMLASWGRSQMALTRLLEDYSQDGIGVIVRLWTSMPEAKNPQQR
jgi:hypothetical protein